MSAISTAIAAAILRRGRRVAVSRVARDFGVMLGWRLYHAPTRSRIMMASSAAAENQAMLRCPAGSTIKAASKGPIDDPALPPTWNSDCANPCCPPEAMRATRDDSGWNTADPIPTSATAASTTAKLGAEAIRISPTMVNVIPTGKEYGVGRWSVYRPTTGCKSDAVSCEVSVISPIWPKSRRYELLKMGYTAGITDCIMSFNRWQKLIAARIRNAVVVSLASAGTLRSVAGVRYAGSSSHGSPPQT